MRALYVDVTVVPFIFQWHGAVFFWSVEQITMLLQREHDIGGQYGYETYREILVERAPILMRLSAMPEMVRTLP
jgi:hypothetical protein